MVGVPRWGGPHPWALPAIGGVEWALQRVGKPSHVRLDLYIWELLHRVLILPPAAGPSVARGGWLKVTPHL